VAGAPRSPAAGARAWWLDQWFRPDPTPATRALVPVAALYRTLMQRSQVARLQAGLGREQPSCPVVAVGNLVVGGAGKTPATIAIVQALQDAGCRPGVVSRGYGRRSDRPQSVDARSSAAEVGDEPLLIHRRTGVPVQVDRDRVAAARALCRAHPSVDIIVADDALQHRQLRRDLDVIVFDERGIGNGLLLPAGPLREPFTPTPPARSLVLYNAPTASTAWPGHCARRSVRQVCRLADWLAGDARAAQPIASLRGGPLLAMAGIAVPARFFGSLRAAGLEFTTLALADHHRYDSPPWPADTQDLITTEKDAVKLGAWAQGPARIWVAALDFDLPAAFVAELRAHLRPDTAP
jgi:tetraacyldisaccharide 4'-kinase